MFDLGRTRIFNVSVAHIVGCYLKFYFNERSDQKTAFLWCLSHWFLLDSWLIFHDTKVNFLLNINLMIPACIRCIEGIYGLEGGNLTLVCPFTPPKDSWITTWIGPPLSTIYFYNERKNPKDLKGGRLSVEKNKTSGAYDLTISNLKLQEDQGIYSCDVNTNPLQQKRFNLAFYGNFMVIL